MDFEKTAEEDFQAQEESITKRSESLAKQEVKEIEKQIKDSRKKILEYRKQEDLAYKQNDKKKQDDYKNLIRQEQDRQSDLQKAYEQLEGEKYSDKQKEEDFEKFKQETSAPLTDEEKKKFKSTDIDEYAKRTREEI